MKKKFGITFLLCALCSVTAFGFAACGEKGDKGDKGDPGVQGEQGIQGVAGQNGQDGKDGATWLVGVVDPTTEAGTEGDLYLNTLTFDLFLKTEGAWVKQGNIKGSDGEDGQDGQDGEDGKDGAQGKPGAQGPQGPQGEAGADGKVDVDSIAVLVFMDETGELLGAPVLVEKGQTAALPMLSAPMKKLVGWTNGLRLITAETPIKDSMILTPVWEPTLELYLGSNDLAAGNAIYIVGQYGGEQWYEGDLDKLCHNGVEYTYEEALEAQLLLDFYTTYEYGQGEYMDNSFKLIFSEAGEYTVAFNVNGAISEISFTVGEVAFGNNMHVESIYFKDSSAALGYYQSGDEVTIFNANRPEAKVEFFFISAMLSEFSATYNGEPIDVSVTNSNQNGWYVTVDAGTFDTSIPTHVFEVTGTSEYSGTVTGTLTVHIGQEDENGIPDEVIMHNSYDKVIVPYVTYENTFNQYVQLYTWHNISVVNELKDANGAGIDSSFITTNVKAWGMYGAFHNQFNLNINTLPVGEYTLTSHITDEYKEGELTTEAVFYVAPNWTCNDMNGDFYSGEPIEWTYTLQEEVTEITLAHFNTLTVGEEKAFTFGGKEITASFAVAEGVTTLTIKTMIDKGEAVDDYWLPCLVTTDTYEYPTQLAKPPVADASIIKEQISMNLVVDLYVFEEYFADQLAIADSPIKAFYDYTNVDIATMTVSQLQAMMSGEEISMLWDNVYDYLYATPFPADKTMDEYVQAMREKVIANSAFDEEMLLVVDEFMGFDFFNDRIMGQEGETAYDLYQLAELEALYLANDGKFLLDMLYYIFDFERMVGAPDMPADYRAMIISIVEAKAAATQAVNSGADNAKELIAAYGTAIGRFISMMME